ncbi:DUF1254 domain-containing protein [Zestomonas carbonaria]|uniref:DUF1254 domain-containing protein n=1 Tax=Zestomonas carbonaria TaxID=2762745 RepID=A0A7U7IB07_9GAMM|nr:DUF1254 domain-containing protein [Pseudomonas carbonaria]CAD5109945.1 hypothetical protein PSEWESI4_04261 [Pseudomonas carbonaria]
MKKLLLPSALGLSLLCPSLAVQALPSLTPEEAREIARDAYIYGYPLVLMQVTREVATNVAEPGGIRAPINQLTHARVFPDASYTDVVRPNADTLYSAMSYDVSREPLVIEVPDSAGRYYLMPMLDFWTDVFTSSGSRTTGNGAQTLAVVGPAWQGRLPAGVRMYRSPTASGVLIGRIQTNGKADYAAVHQFQDGMKTYPLSAYGKPYVAPKGTVNPQQDMTAPPLQLDRMSGEVFFSRFAELLKDNPPHANDNPILDRMQRIGLEVGKDFSYDAAPQVVRDALDAAPADALKQIKQAFRHSGVTANGWRTNLTAIGTYGTDYLRRAGVAYAGLGANPIEDAIYPTAFVDSEGRPLDGGQRYVLHFAKEQIPPVRAFWSLTMYDERQLFTENPIERFAIGDRDKLVFNPDGSLDIYIQRESPGKDKEDNWLPTPAKGQFSMNLRLYWPKGQALDGVTWLPPAVERVD